MKKMLIILLLVAFVLSLTVSANALVGEGRKKRVLTRDWNIQRRYVRGAAAQSLGPNFLDNDWDRVDEGSWSNLTQADKDFLKTVSGLDAGIWYYIDLTTHTVNTTGFQDYSWGYTEVLDAYTTVEVTVNIIYQCVLAVYDYSPIVLDLDGNNKIDVAKNNWRPHAPKFYRQYAKFFDITGDGADDFTEWLAPNSADGLLVIPDNGEVRGALQLFGTAGGYKDGYEKLSIVSDKDNNGWVEGKELEGLAIWIDKNNDAVCQKDELKSLSAFNIKRISTAHKDYVSKFLPYFILDSKSILSSFVQSIRMKILTRFHLLQSGNSEYPF